MKKLIVLILLLLPTALRAAIPADSTKVQKKERTVDIYGEVYDSFTKAKIDAFVTLMREDSTVIDTMTCWTWNTSSFYQFKVTAKQQRLIIKGTRDGYEDTYMNYELRHLARNRYFELPRLLMKKKQDDVWREDSLGGVEVRGTRVKIAYRGDTIVYNASAFNLPEGSMLDGLIRQLPGAELRQNGDIYINGEKVDYLTLNGKDFFKGQNQVMLDNLPYYTVQNIKVYHKSTKQSQLAGKDIERKEYVMDVNLKREYARGYIANAEAGAGTEERYMGRMFGLYYSDHTRLSVYGNMNNVNEDRKPGGEGEWSPSNMSEGLLTTRQAGIDFNTEDADKDFEEEGSVTVMWRDAQNESHTQSEVFASEGSIFSGAWSTSRQKDFSLSAENELTINKPFSLYSRASLSYTNGRRTTASKDSTYRDMVTNMTQNDGLNKYRMLSADLSLSHYKKLSWGDFYSLYAYGTLNRTKPSDDFSRQLTHYTTSGNNDLRDRYADTHSDDYNWNVGGSYNVALLNKWNIRPSVRYQQAWTSNHNSNYRLDWLGSMRPHDMGWLPSTRDSLLMVIDTNNSDNSQQLTRTYQASLGIFKTTDDYMINLELPFSHIAERLHYDDGELDTIARRHSNELSPRIDFYVWKGGWKQFSYNFDVERPSLASLMPVDDTVNPLAYRVNNPGLKNHITHSFSAHYSHNVDSLKREFSSWASVNIHRNSWGTRTTYVSSTGAYSYMNDNVNGNWNASGGASYSMPLDKARRLILTESADASYLHSVDFDIQYVETELQLADPILSTVNNWTLHDRLRLQYQKDELTATLSGNVSWRNSTSDRQNFQRINAFDYDYGASLNYVIPWVKVSLATDIRMYSRRGYYSESMNDNHLVWNAQLSRSLLKGRMTAKLTAFDLLHELSSTQYNVNAQGRTETWNNCIPRYVMLSVLYKFTKRPKE